MSSRRQPPGQLEMPLVWELEPVTEGEEPADERRSDDDHGREQVGALRLVLAGLADLGTLLLFFAAAWLIAAAAGADRGSWGQLALVALMAVGTASVAAVGLVWAWRGSPGLLVLNVGFARPLPMGVAVRLWLCWMFFLPLGAIPLVVGRPGSRPAERLAGAALSFRLPRGSA